jgi:hypothetical protein
MSMPGQFLTCRVDELRPHPSYVRNHLTVSASQFSTLVELGNLAFREPITIASDRTILDGYGRVKLAQSMGRATLPCILYELSETETLQYLLQRHRRCIAWNAFTRILLALDPEPGLEEKAGQNKGLSKLAEAERFNIRSEIAAAAGARPTNVGKVKKLTVTASPEILQALLNGEISIHRAWLWSEEPKSHQLAELRQYRDNQASKKIKRLISRHKPKSLLVTIDSGGVLRRLAGLGSDELSALSVVVINGPVKAIYLTEDLFHSLLPYQEQMPT